MKAFRVEISETDKDGKPKVEYVEASYFLIESATSPLVFFDDNEKIIVVYNGSRWLTVEAGIG